MEERKVEGRRAERIERERARCLRGHLIIVLKFSGVVFSLV
jgi:hypothetical protein